MEGYNKNKKKEDDQNIGGKKNMDEFGEKTEDLGTVSEKKTFAVEEENKKEQDINNIQEFNIPVYSRVVKKSQEIFLTCNDYDSVTNERNKMGAELRQKAFEEMSQDPENTENIKEELEKFIKIIAEEANKRIESILKGNYKDFVSEKSVQESNLENLLPQLKSEIAKASKESEVKHEQDLNVKTDIKKEENEVPEKNIKEREVVKEKINEEATKKGVLSELKKSDSLGGIWSWSKKNSAEGTVFSKVKATVGYGAFFSLAVMVLPFWLISKVILKVKEEWKKQGGKK